MRDEPHARAGQLAPRDLRQRASSRPASSSARVGDVARFPRSFVIVRSADGEAAPARPAGPAPALGSTGRRVGSDTGARRGGDDRDATGQPGRGRGTKILEFGSGAAGPIATRYFVEHGATVLRVESRSRPDFLRVYALGPDNPHGLEGSPMFDGLNVGKRNVTLNLKHPEGRRARRSGSSVEWADAVAENFAPRAMRGFGLDYDSLAAHKPDLVMVSACLNGQTGPHRDYPGFGGQGSALSGFNWLTGWPDREPVGPYGTITDSLAPRFVATALAAGPPLPPAHRARRVPRPRPGRGRQLLAVARGCSTTSATATIGDAHGNRSPRARAARRCSRADEATDRWVAIACWTDDEWARSPGSSASTTRRSRRSTRGWRVDEVEAAVTPGRRRARDEVAELLQAAGIEAVPVEDFGDVHDDPQVAHREHFVAAHPPVHGRRALRAQRLPAVGDAPRGYDRPGPTLGQDNDWVLGDLLGLSPDERAALAADGVLE